MASREGFVEFTRLLRSNRGVTIVEMTVVLSVMFILAGVMSPIVSESITTARAVRAKNDALMIASGLVNFQRDLAGDAGTLGSALTSDTAIELPDVLMTAGSLPIVDNGPGSALSGLHGVDTTTSGLHEVGSTRMWVDADRDRLEDHLVRNGNGYRLRKPGEYGGWNGPYVSSALKGDPWGNSYLVNTGFLGGASAADGQGGVRRAVFVVSAGADGILQTPFNQPLTDARAYGDDIVVRIQ